MKVYIRIFTLFLFVTLLTGCGNKDNTGNNATPTPTKTAEVTPTATPTEATTPDDTAEPDVVTTASIVNTEDAFLNAISNKGTWIIAVLNDMTINEDLSLDGEFKNGKKDDAGNDIVQRKIALYTQDEERNITARFTLTAPRITINSPKASIQHGTFKGDVYVNVADFELVDATVDGNVYFASDDVKNSFKMDATSKVTGKQEVKAAE
ncbi:MAG: hypothetical protein K0S41_3892 [Anaerocolumna sp.]|jgi:hypothetical protein|nr:hypothetical protein [Anaerocolumna sp.]